MSESKEVIPDAAVEAALCALFPDEPDVKAFKSVFWLPTITTILEAAAPHLIQAAKADAWDEGRVVGMMDPHRIEQSIKLNAPEYAQVANPYR